MAQGVLFNCPTCGVEYKIVRVPVDSDSIIADRELTCRKCDGPLRGREGRFVLKYFLVGTGLSIEEPVNRSEYAGWR